MNSEWGRGHRLAEGALNQGFGAGKKVKNHYSLKRNFLTISPIFAAPK
jgi:hypothetical protein